LLGIIELRSKNSTSVFRQLFLIIISMLVADSDGAILLGFSIAPSEFLFVFDFTFGYELRRMLELKLSLVRLTELFKLKSLS
jgi:hypothetical protein